MNTTYTRAWMGHILIFSVEKLADTIVKTKMVNNETLQIIILGNDAEVIIGTIQPCRMDGQATVLEFSPAAVQQPNVIYRYQGRNGQGNVKLFPKTKFFIVPLDEKGMKIIITEI